MKCKECKKEVIHFHNSHFCKDCAPKFFNGEEDHERVDETKNTSSK